MKKKLLEVIITATLAIVVFTACSDGGITNNSSDNGTSTASQSTNATSSYNTSSSNSSKNFSSSSSGSFTNKYGTSSTKCAKSGCNNYIASSGDTNCCTTHSNKCLECKKYIDSDATYCMSCLSKAANKTSGSSNSGTYSGSSTKSSSNNSTSSGTHKCYICGDNAYSKYGSYYYCSESLKLVKSFSK